MIRVAVLSFWHVHAKDYVQQAQRHPAVEIAAAWDELPARGQAEAQKLGVPFYERLEELLAQETIDGVIVVTPTNMHQDVMVAAARAKKHIFTEKVLAPTMHECRAILEVVAQAGVKLVVSLPRLNAGYTRAIRDILARNLLGELTLVRVRLSHNGALSTAEAPHGWLPAHFFNLEQCAGGAMIDLGCHPMYLTRLFLGMPASVSASYGYLTGRAVEDNAVVTLRYANGALGVVEAGFVNRYSPFTIEVHGTDGSLLYGTPESTLCIRSARLDTQEGPGWHNWADMPPDLPSAFEQWVTHIEQGTIATENIALATDLTQLMEAANRSAQNSTVITLSY
jgi:1,5-anhydro-D-fructose reductase (1,5-anhydro-D-mannitol-forming)